MGNQITTPTDERIQDLTTRGFFGPFIKEAYRAADREEQPTADLLGFPLEKGSADNTLDLDEQEQTKDGTLRLARAEKEKERVRKWEDMVNYCREHNLSLPQHPKFYARVIKGMPAMVRGNVWAQLLDTDRIKERYEQVGIQEHTWDRKMQSYYECLVQHGADHPNEYNGPRGYIDRDLGRTFPRHPLFAGGDPQQSPAIQSLKNVLVAYSAHHAQIGYTQGMNYIVAMLLGFMPEEHAFWALIAIMGKREARPATTPRRSGEGSGGGGGGAKDIGAEYNFEDIMKKGLPLAQQHFWCLDRLLERRLPKLYQQLADCDVRAEVRGCTRQRCSCVLMCAFLKLRKVTERISCVLDLRATDVLAGLDPHPFHSGFPTHFRRPRMGYVLGVWMVHLLQRCTVCSLQSETRVDEVQEL